MAMLMLFKCSRPRAIHRPNIRTEITACRKGEKSLADIPIIKLFLSFWLVGNYVVRTALIISGLSTINYTRRPSDQGRFPSTVSRDVWERGQGVRTSNSADHSSAQGEAATEDLPRWRLDVMCCSLNKHHGKTCPESDYTPIQDVTRALRFICLRQTNLREVPTYLTRHALCFLNSQYSIVSSSDHWRVVAPETLNQQQQQSPLTSS